MNMSHFTHFNSKATALLVAIGSLVGITNANAQTVYLTFSGGGGSPFVISWSTPIVYTLSGTSVSSGFNPYFVFSGITNISTAVPVDTVATFSGAPTYSSTGVGSGDGTQTINSFYWKTPHGVVGANDMEFRATLDTAATILTVGDVITLTAGSLHNNTPYSGIMPISGYYNTFITDAADGANLGSGSAIPEPSTYAAFAGLGVLGFAVWRRRKSVSAKLTA